MTEIWRDFDPNLEIPLGLKNARVLEKPELPEEVDGFTDFDDDTDDDDDLDEDGLGVPDGFTIVDQQVRTASDGSQVVDVIIEIDDIDGALNYEVRLTKV
jgi:hypothetical protein